MNRIKRLFEKCCFLLGMLLCGVFLSFSIPNSKENNKGVKGVSFRAATYNIRYDAAADKETGNDWDTRKEALAKLILRHGFDIVGTQEGMTKQVIDLKKLLPGFDYIGYPYGGKNDHHNAVTFFKTDLFEVMDAGAFWLSETPDVPSIGWDANDRRICHWAKFKEKKSGEIFYYFNAHFFWQLEIARRETGPLIVRKIAEIAGDSPVICVGDFNSTSETSQIEAMKSSLLDAYDSSKNGRKGVNDTNLGGGVFHGDPKNRIDYILVSKNMSVTDYEVYSDKYNGDRYPSDHLPVSCIVSF